MLTSLFDAQLIRFKRQEASEKFINNVQFLEKENKIGT